MTRQLVLKDFVPVKRRRRTDYPGGLNDGVTPHATLPYALRLFTTNLLHEPRLTYNVKIVIVGASDTGMAVAERLIYTPHLNFTNITVVSLDGLPQLDVHNAAATSMFADAMCYDADELKQIGLENYVNDIPGRVTMIDRDLKHLILSDDSVIPYV